MLLTNGSIPSVLYETLRMFPPVSLRFIQLHPASQRVIIDVPSKR